MSSTWKKTAGWLGTLALIAVVTACGGNPPPEPEPEPEPQVEEPTVDEAAERARMEEEARQRREDEERRRLEAERNRVMSVMSERVHFDFDKSDIRTDAEEVLQRKVTVLREYPGVKVRVEGHCDERGSNEYNLALGQRRAEAVRRYLLSYGIDASRFATISYGEERPAVSASNEQAWEENRRAEFAVTDRGSL